MEWNSQIQGVGLGWLPSLYSLEATHKIARNKFVSTSMVSDLSSVTRKRLAWKWNMTLYIPSFGLLISPTETPTNQRQNETRPADGGCSCAAS